MTFTHWLAPMVHQPSVWSALSTFCPTARLTTSSVWLQTVNSACALLVERTTSSAAPNSAQDARRPRKSGNNRNQLRFVRVEGRQNGCEGRRSIGVHIYPPSRKYLAVAENREP